MHQLFAINGSASENASNQRLLEALSELAKDRFQMTIYNELKKLPHFDPDRAQNDPPASILEFRQHIEQADGIVICTPEYIFSLPSGLKNAIEWCVATTVFSDKPTGLITASANGQKGHQELQSIMNTLMAELHPETTLLIPGVKGKIDPLTGQPDSKTTLDLVRFMTAFDRQLTQS